MGDQNPDPVDPDLYAPSVTAVDQTGGPDLKKVNIYKKNH